MAVGFWGTTRTNNGYAQAPLSVGEAESLPAELLEQYTAYSPEVAEAMALGVQKRLRADLAVSTTGVAGPMGGTELAPVGTVYLGLAGPDGVESRRVNLLGDRELIAARASLIASSRFPWARSASPILRRTRETASPTSTLSGWPTARPSRMSRACR